MLDQLIKFACDVLKMELLVTFKKSPSSPYLLSSKRNLFDNQLIVYTNSVYCSGFIFREFIKDKPDLLALALTSSHEYERKLAEDVIKEMREATVG